MDLYPKHFNLHTLNSVLGDHTQITRVANSSKMGISIIIVNYNTKDLVSKCIISILASKPRMSFEIIVIDNGSSDGSQKYLQRLLDKRIKIILNIENLGYSKANNIGIKNSKGKFKLLLNSDCEIKNKALDKLYNFAERSKDAGVIGARLFNSDGTLQASCFRFPTIGRAIKQYWLGQKNLLNKYAPQTNGPTEVEALVGAAFLITQKALKEVGLLDERYFMYFEDLDYCRRVHEVGLKVYYLPSAEITHYHGMSGKKLIDTENQWKRLIPSSKIYHGVLKHYLINFIIWSGQKFFSA